jgi:hypothetical protein
MKKKYKLYRPIPPKELPTDHYGRYVEFNENVTLNPEMIDKEHNEDDHYCLCSQCYTNMQEAAQLLGKILKEIDDEKGKELNEV